eukprot:CAMPEP_0173188728 /NCGR_PEP_ID=MMETSP1141-20130122/11406_1 /TAXON_ID=483371 /ORGANISM="non described non described, Strain CCMP2298" /LENGTH=103 /DNA_ID=CAMNT_0014112669 /DNA_START=60 /DNA_END=371 /DNA_ORIENTATION=+
MYLLVFVIALLLSLAPASSQSTAYDQSLKAKGETIAPEAKVHRSIADIVAKATSRIGKTASKKSNKKATTKELLYKRRTYAEQKAAAMELRGIKIDDKQKEQA